MKTLLTLTLVVLMAGSAFAQLDNSMGMFFSDTELSEANTNIDPAGQFQGYVAILNTTVFSIAAYEVGVDIDNAGVFVLGLEGPNGLTNFGSFTNQLCGYQTPLPAPEGEVVLATMEFLYTGTDPVNVTFGAANPSSFDDMGPGIADGADPTILLLCNYTSDQDVYPEGLVATFFGDGIEFPGGVATESQSWSGVKALF
jgi:hypothetical protein